jgi:hypothetical protein
VSRVCVRSAVRLRYPFAKSPARTGLRNHSFIHPRSLLPPPTSRQAVYYLGSETESTGSPVLSGSRPTTDISPCGPLLRLPPPPRQSPSPRQAVCYLDSEASIGSPVPWLSPHHRPLIVRSTASVAARPSPVAVYSPVLSVLWLSPHRSLTVRSTASLAATPSPVSVSSAPFNTARSLQPSCFATPLLPACRLYRLHCECIHHVHP